MLNSSIANHIALAVVACTSLAEGPRLYAQESGLPEPIRVALAQYMHLDPLAVTLSETTEAAEMGKQKIAKEVLGRIVAYNTNVQQIAFREGRIYVRREGKEQRTFEVAFDRSVLYMGDPAKGPNDSKHRPFLQKLLPKNDNPEGSYFSLPYFRAAGIRMPTQIKGLVAAWCPRSELLTLLAEGGRVEATSPASLEGRSLVRVEVTANDWSLQGISQDLSETKNLPLWRPGISAMEVQRTLSLARKLQQRRAPLRRHDFYLDPERAYALRRLDIRDDAGRLVMRSDCTEHEQLTGRDVWMPRRCRVEEYTFHELRDEETLIPLAFGSPLYVNHFKVSEFDLHKWPEDRFELKYTTPGTEVNDGTLPGVTEKNGVRYVIPASAQQLDKVVEAALAKYQRAVNARKWSPTVKLVLMVLNVVLMVGLAVYFVVRRRKVTSA